MQKRTQGVGTTLIFLALWLGPSIYCLQPPPPPQKKKKKKKKKKIYIYIRNVTVPLEKTLKYIEMMRKKSGDKNPDETALKEKSGFSLFALVILFCYSNNENMKETMSLFE